VAANTLSGDIAMQFMIAVMRYFYHQAIQWIQH
jgi:hypothetical protein